MEKSELRQKWAAKKQNVLPQDQFFAHSENDMRWILVIVRAKDKLIAIQAKPIGSL